MVYVITEECVDVQDKSCMQECPADCIFDGRRMTYINPNLCIDCGACMTACPVDAVYYDAELPADKEEYVEINERFFEEVETPKSGRKAGKIDYDVDVIAVLLDALSIRTLRPSPSPRCRSRSTACRCCRPSAPCASGRS